MIVQLQIESKIDTGFIASLGPPFNASAEGTTIGEAIEKLGQETRRHEAEGHAPSFIEIPTGDHPLLKWAGTLPDDELTRDWLETIRENRRQRDADDERNGVDW